MVTTIYQSLTAFKEATNYVDPGNPSLVEAGTSCSKGTGIHLSPKALEKKKLLTHFFSGAWELFEEHIPNSS